jgi:hypothetical protein
MLHVAVAAAAGSAGFLFATAGSAATSSLTYLQRDEANFRGGKTLTNRISVILLNGITIMLRGWILHQVVNTTHFGSNWGGGGVILLQAALASKIFKGRGHVVVFGADSMLSMLRPHGFN